MTREHRAKLEHVASEAIMADTREAITAALARIDALEADAARLDWLEKKGFSTAEALMSAPNADRPFYCMDCGERLTGGSHDCPGPDWQCPLCGEWWPSRSDECGKRLARLTYCEGRKPE